MPEIDLVYGCISRELERAIGTGSASQLGEAIGTSILEALEKGARCPSREQLAAMAMQGMLAVPGVERRSKKTIVKRAFRVADAFLAEAKAHPELDQS